MRKTFLLLILAIAFSGFSLKARATIWTEHEQGWFWYGPFKGLPEQRKPKKPKRKPAPKTTARTAKGKKGQVSYTELLKEVRALLAEIQARALLNPTPENVAAWYAAQALTMRMAGDFTQASLLVPVLHPELDLSSLLPGEEWGSQVLAYTNAKRKKETLEALGNRGALVIFYRSPGCFLCEREMEVMRILKKTYDFRIYALYEGSPPAGADRSKPVTPEILSALEVKTFPSLFYFKDGRFHFVGMGALGTSEVERRLLLLARANGWTDYEPLYVLDRLPVWEKLGLEGNGTGNELERLIEVLKRLKEQGY